MSRFRENEKGRGGIVAKIGQGLIFTTSTPFFNAFLKRNESRRYLEERTYEELFDD